MLATHYLPHGYRFFVQGSVKPGRDLAAFDALMESKFRYSLSRSGRNRRKNARGPDGQRLGLGNVHYIRFDRSWVLLATKGTHRFFDEHTKRDPWGHVQEVYFRDVHRDPIFLDGYSLRVAKGGYLARYKWPDASQAQRDTRQRVRVRIAEETFRTLKADLIARAASGRWSARELEALVWNLPFLPFAPVREQFRALVRWMNRARKARGFSDLLDPRRCVRRKIAPISAFEPRESALRKLGWSSVLAPELTASALELDTSLAG
jgi:hypothetical protein